MNAWQSIFFQSPVNSGYYDEDELPQLNWEWPNGTWFQARLEYIRDYQPLRHSKSQKNSREKNNSANDVVSA